MLQKKWNKTKLSLFVKNNLSLFIEEDCCILVKNKTKNQLRNVKFFNIYFWRWSTESGCILNCLRVCILNWGERFDLYRHRGMCRVSSLQTPGCVHQPGSFLSSVVSILEASVCRLHWVNHWQLVINVLSSPTPLGSGLELKVPIF